MKKEPLSTAIDSAPAAADHSASWLQNEYTWIGLAFAITVFLFIRYLVPTINKALDARAEKIRDQLEQANRLRAEAQELLATYKAEQESMLKQAEEIVATAKRDAAAMRSQAAAELKSALERRTSQAHEKIARAEAEAVASIRTRIVESATESARMMLAEQSSGAAEDHAIARAISAIEAQIH